MKRSEFDALDTISDLIEFGQEENLYCTEDIYWEDSYSDLVWEEIHDWDGSFYELGRALCDLPDGFAWVRRDGYLDYVGIDEDDFDDLRREIIEEMEDYWDDEDEPDDEQDDREECEAPDSCVIIEFVKASTNEGLTPW